MMSNLVKGRPPGAVARPLLGKKARAGLARAVKCIKLTPADICDDELMSAVQWLLKLAAYHERDDVKAKLQGKASAQKAYKASKKLGGGE